MIGYVLWALLLAGMLVLEGLGLTLRGHEWPTVSDLFRSATRATAGRWLFFALWLWTGWHFFIRGWAFFLQGKGAGTPSAQGGSKGFLATITQVIVPLLVLGGMLGTVLVTSYKRARSQHVATHEMLRSFPRRVCARPAAFAVFAVATLVAGYIIFVVVIGVYELAVGNSAHGIFGSALTYGAFLDFAVALPAFALLTLTNIALARIKASHQSDTRAGRGAIATTPDSTHPVTREPSTRSHPNE